MTPLPTLPHDAFDFLKSEETIAAYLDAVMEADGFHSVEERIAFIADAYAAVKRARAIVPLLNGLPPITDEDREWLNAKPMGNEIW